MTWVCGLHHCCRQLPESVSEPSVTRTHALASAVRVLMLVTMSCLVHGSERLRSSCHFI